MISGKAKLRIDVTPQIMQTIQTVAIARTVVTVVWIELHIVCVIERFTRSSSSILLPRRFSFSLILS